MSERLTRDIKGVEENIRLWGRGGKKGVKKPVR